MLIAEIGAALAGFALVAVVLSGAIRTVVVPRDEQVLLNRVVFRIVRECFELFASERRPYRDRDRVMARYAPTGLMALPVVWMIGVLSGFSLIFWALDVRPYRNALVLAGSSVTTLGFERSDNLAVLLIAIAEAIIGLGLVALLISFLPTMYSHFSRREVIVTKLHNWATDDNGARAVNVLVRAHRIDGIERLQSTWADWENWFVELEESHTTFPALPFFRSPTPDRSWITMAGVALDSASLFISCVETKRHPAAPIMIRAGYLSLRHIAGYYGVPFDPAPRPHDPISVTEAEFSAIYDELAQSGVPVRADRAQAWRDFAGWRVNYDEVLIQLASFTIAPEQEWVTDRNASFRRSRVIRPRQRGGRWTPR